MSRRYPLFILIGFHLILLCLTKFTLWPEMVVYPFLLNHNFLLYKDLINPYPPLFTVFLSSFTSFFGYTPMAMRVLTYMAIVAIDILIFNFSIKLFKNRKAAICNTLFFVLFSIPFGVNGLWFDLFQTPFILAGIYYLVSAKKPQNFPIAIGLFALAFFIKQQAIWIMPVYVVYAFKYYKLFKLDFGKIILESVAVVGILGLANLGLVFAFGTYPEFISWAVIFPFFKAKDLPGYIAPPSMSQVLLLVSLFSAFIPALIESRIKNQELSKTNYGIYFAAVLLVLFAYPRFDYFHLVPALALLSLLVFVNFRGLTPPALSQLWKRGETSKINRLSRQGETSKILKRTPATLLYLFFIPVILFSARQYKGDFGFQTRFFEPEILQAAQQISKKTKPNDLLYLQNSPDQLLVLSNRLPVKPWADEFPWYLEYEKTQQNVFKAIKNIKPEFVVSFPYAQGTKFQQGAYQPLLIASYLQKNYKVISKLGGNLRLVQKITND